MQIKTNLCQNIDRELVQESLKKQMKSHSDSLTPLSNKGFIYRIRDQKMAEDQKWQ